MDARNWNRDTCNDIRQMLTSQARKAIIDIERKPHMSVRSYSSAQEREVLVKASQAAQSAISINATAAGIGTWVYKTLGY